MLKKWFLTLLLLSMVGAGWGFSFAQHSYPPSSGILTRLVPYPQDPSKLIVASEKEVFIRSEGRSWKRILSLHEKSDSIRQILVHPRWPEKIFVLSKEGLQVADLKSFWPQWIFRVDSISDNQTYAMALHPQDPARIYVGTERGLFRSRDGGRHWLRAFQWPENQRVEFVGFLPTLPPTLLLGAKGELFFSKDDGETFESGFSLPLLAEENLEENGDEELETPSYLPRFTAFAFSLKEPSRIWIGTRTGVFESQDGGVEWSKLPDEGLRDTAVKDLLFEDSTGQLIAAHSAGIARFDSDHKRWENLAVGAAQSPSSLALRSSQKEKTLLIAAGNEIIEWVLNPVEISGSPSSLIPSPERIQLFQKLVLLEPTVRDAQKAAVRYGDLGNGKIERWHWGSRMRAFIPSVSFGRNFSTGNNVDIDRGGTGDPDRFILGPNDKDRSWNMGVRWELGDFIWSTAQTSIDSREKLMVELRESILSQINRIYFERRRTQIEMVFSPPPSQQEFLELLLRFEELTAELDALTDGFFSRELEKIYQREPELNQLRQMKIDSFQS